MNKGDFNKIETYTSKYKDNFYHGVDLNDKKAVKKKLFQMRVQHFFSYLLTFVILGVLACPVYDFVGVNFMDKDPIFYKREVVNNGSLYKGIGYEMLKCKDGEKYVSMSKILKSCVKEEGKEKTFNDVLYNSFIKYARSKKIIREKELESLDFVNVTLDGDYKDGGHVYVVDLEYSCKDDSTSCMKVIKETVDLTKKRIYVIVNNLNETIDVTGFMDHGLYYDSLVSDYEAKVKEYLINNNFIDVDNLRHFNISLELNKGATKFRKVLYYDSYVIGVHYLCNDNEDTCVTFEGRGHDSLSFELSMFLDENNDISLLGPVEYFDL